MFKNFFVSLLLAGCSASWGAVAFESAHVVVVDEVTGQVLLEKDAAAAAPIASLTKLMTAMVVLDAQQDASEILRIEDADMDSLKHTRGGLPVGATASRGTLLELALIASDNHAAAALARNFSDGIDGFSMALRRKIDKLGLANTTLVEPTGLSPNNHSSALDMVKVLQATLRYPLIAAITSKRGHAVVVNGQPWEVRNTNGFVGQPGWEILASKTGFTNEAGRCLTMRLRAAGRTVIVVLMGAMAASERALDALNIQRWLAGKTPLLAASMPTPMNVNMSAPNKKIVRAVHTQRARSGQRKNT